MRIKDLLLRTARPLLRGNRVECPVCGGRFRMFLPFHGRRNAICAGCGSLERDRLVWLFLREGTNLFSDSLRVLHVAPERAIQERLRPLPNLDYLSGDLLSPLAMMRVDLQDIELPDESFDVIICNHVLDDVPDDRRAMRELRRILRPTGWALMQTPVHDDLAETREGGDVDAGSVRTYGRDFVSRLEDAGFTVEVDRFAATLDADRRTRFAIDPSEPVYLCTARV
jgi:SAM-dependent methyltransferase